MGDRSSPEPSNGGDRDSTGAAVDLHELLTVEDVAALLRVSKKWVYEHTRSRRMPRSERLPHLKLGKYIRFEARAVRECLARQR